MNKRALVLDQAQYWQTPRVKVPESVSGEKKFGSLSNSHICLAIKHGCRLWLHCCGTESHSFSKESQSDSSSTTRVKAIFNLYLILPKFFRDTVSAESFVSLQLN